MSSRMGRDRAWRSARRSSPLRWRSRITSGYRPTGPSSASHPTIGLHKTCAAHVPSTPLRRRCTRDPRTTGHIPSTRRPANRRFHKKRLRNNLVRAVTTRPEFVVLVQPEMNIVVYRYLPARQYRTEQILHNISEQDQAIINEASQSLQRRKRRAGVTFVS